MMTLQTTFIYLPCRKCTEKIRCDACQGRLTEAAARLPGVQHAEIVLAAKRIRLEGDFDPSDAEDGLEAMGLFLD
ncbi:MAG: heavy-metal-associated domain-containing protein [Oscillospiraceae bacterium]